MGKKLFKMQQQEMFRLWPVHLIKFVLVFPVSELKQYPLIVFPLEIAGKDSKFIFLILLISMICMQSKPKTSAKAKKKLWRQESRIIFIGSKKMVQFVVSFHHCRFFKKTKFG